MVQAVHAAYESGKIYGDISRIDSTVICQTQSQTSLLLEAERLKKLDINFYLFYEPDLNNEATALCTEPLSAEFKKLFKKWKLWNK